MRYSRDNAVAYARGHALTACSCGNYYGSVPPPQQPYGKLLGDPHSSDCCHFVSHCLAAGGVSNAGVEAFATDVPCGAGAYIVHTAFLVQWLSSGIAKQVTRKELKPGDVTVFPSGDRLHTMIYLGDGTFAGHTNYHIIGVTDSPRVTYYHILDSVDEAKALLDRACEIGNQGRYREAVRLLEQAITYDQKNIEIWGNMGFALFMLGRYQESLQAYDKALGLNQNSALGWLGKGVALGWLRRPGEALIALDRSLALDPNNPIAWSDKGRALFSLNRYGESMQAFDRSLALDPNDHRAWNDKGILLGRLGRHSEALQAFDRALSLDPNDQLVIQNRKTALFYLGR